ncbi:MAG: GNAT family N-acetyltransferase [Aggregatilineales bacterium]
MSAQFSIRSALPHETPAIARVHIASWQTTYVGLLPEEYLRSLSFEAREKQWQRALDQPEHCLFIAERDGTMVGFAYGSREEGLLEAYSGQLYAIYLLEAVQGMGLGRALAQAVVDCLRARGHRSMVVWVLAENHRARRFYEALGGSEVGQQMITIGNIELEDIAYGWDDLDTFGRSKDRQEE